jgi:FKBP-type peptidyl-prolyl cis-trans isomerase
VAPASEIQAVKDYLTSKSITAIQDPSGVFYLNTQEGAGTATPTVCSTINFIYKGTLTNGKVFDGPSTLTFPLQDLIAGWQIIIPKMKRGGKTTLYIPPTLGYGSREIKDNLGNVIIPANSILIFDIELLNF